MKTTTLLTTMLAGAAVCALSTAPATAAPNIHLAIAKNGVAKAMGFGKTVIRDQKPHNNSTVTATQTVTFSAADYSETGHLGQPTLLWAETWYATTKKGKCVQPKKQDQDFPKKTKAAKIKTGTTTAGNPCATGNFTYFGPVYTLKSKTATYDSFSGVLTANKFKVKGYNTYNLTLNENTILHIGHP
jgi:hypothetical protein